METKRLYRSRTDRMIGGVAGGLGNYFAIDPIIIRLIFVVLALTNGVGVLLYLIAWVVIPEDPASVGKDDKHHETVESRVRGVADDVEQVASKVKERESGRMLGGLLLLVLGVLFLLENVTGFDVWENFWPLLLIALGVGIMIKSAAKKEV